MTPLSPFFKYFGSKARSAKLYPAPRHDVIVEPFAGGAGYSLNYHERDVILCDLDPRVVTIWNYLIDATADQIMALPLLQPGQSIDDVDISDGARMFLSCCVNTSPFRKSLAQWKNGQNDGLWGEKLRARVASQVRAIKHWTVVCGSYADLLNIEATHFVDPMYQGMEQHYAISRKHPTDYTHLAQWCRSRRGQVIVCERAGATWLPFRHLADVCVVRNKRDDRKCSEAIWTNDDEPRVELVAKKPRGQVTLFEERSNAIYG